MTDLVAMRWAVGQGLTKSNARRLRLVSDGEELRLEQAGAPVRVLGTRESLTAATVRSGVEVRSLRSWPTDRLADVDLTRGLLPRVGRSRAVDQLRAKMEGDTPRGLVINDEAGPVIVLDLLDFAPRHSPLNMFDGSAAVDLVASLGLTCEQAGPADVGTRRAEGKALIRPDRRLLAAARAVWLLAVSSAGLSIFAANYVDDWPGPIHVVACALVVMATSGLAWSRWAFARTVRIGLDAAGRAVLPIAAGVPGTQLQIGRDDLVLVLPHDAEEQWYAGPGAGGVSRVEIGREQTWFVRGEDDLIVALETADLVPTDADDARLRACCDQAGIEIVAGGLGADVGSGPVVPLRLDEARRPGLWMDSVANGELGLSVPIACGSAAAMGLIAPLGPGEVWGAAGWCLVGLHLACGIVVAWGSWSLIKWRRSIRKAARS